MRFLADENLERSIIENLPPDWVPGTSPEGTVEAVLRGA